MKIVYEDNEYELDLDELDVQQARTIKAKCGLTIMGLEQGLGIADPDAMRALFWLMLVQSGDTSADIDRLNFKIVKFAKALNEATEAQEAADKAANKRPGKTGSRASSRA